MKILNLILVIISLNAYNQNTHKSSTNFRNISDTSKVIELNKQAFDVRLINPDITVNNATKSLNLAIKLKYTDGIAESHRVIGVGKSYKNSIGEAIESYLNALRYFKESNNLGGQAKVYNNIGALYRNIDYNKSLENFNKSLAIAQRLNMKDLIAGLHLNIGTVNQQLHNYNRASSYYKLSLSMFQNLNNKLGIIQSEQNLGVLYYNLGKFNISEEYLLNALIKAKANNFNNSIGRINLTLSSLYIAQKKFTQAERTIKEGQVYSLFLQDSKLQYNYMLRSFELEKMRKNYKDALEYLLQVYKQDSITYASNISDKIHLLESQHIQLQKQRENELTIERQKNTKILLWASCAIGALAFFVILLLVKNVKRSAKTNEELTRLNEEVSRQKDDLDRTNQNLEGIIEDRTRDLQIKNKKLSEYSSHLSHQIRSPVATLKGLMLLEDDKLIDKGELIEQMAKCINDLDDKIININENLNNPTKSSLIADE